MPRTIAETVEALKELQSVDDRLGGLRETVASLSLRVEDHKKHVAGLEAELEAKTKQLRTEEKNSGMKELDVKSVRDKIAKFREQLNSLTSNKQYAAMLHEIGGEEAKQTKFEDEVLALMVNMDKTRDEMAAIRGHIKEAQEAVKLEEAAAAAEMRTLAGQIRELSAERQALVARIEPVHTARYDRIFRSKHGKALVAVRDGVCQGCHMGVTRQTITRLWAQKELMHCPNCARLIYLEGEVQ